MLSGFRSGGRALALVVGLLAASGFACTSSDDDPKDATTASSACADVKIERYKELAIVDEAVIDDPRAKNATGGVWSFRHAIEEMTPESMTPSQFVLDWLTGWVKTPMINGYPVDQPGQARDAEMNRLVVCPWLKRTPENACDEGCNTCASKTLDLAKAPFRLLAITNRMDLREEVEGETSGEGRLVFGMAEGLGDDPAAKMSNATIIFEYRLADTRSPKEWAEAWHALGAFPAFDESYKTALEGVTNAFVKRGADPKGVNGSSLGQIRTSELYLHWNWQMREFALGHTGELEGRALRNTPAVEQNNSPALAQFVSANAEKIRANKFEMPLQVRGPSTVTLTSPWKVPNADEPTRKALSRNTCNGCHSSDETTVDSRYHVSPFKRGVDKLSPFMTVDLPGKPSDLTVRTGSLQRALCSQ